MKFLIIILFTTLSFSQNIFHDKQFGFAVQEPTEWIRAEKNETIENLKNIKFPEETINKLLEKNKGKIEIVSFYKYPINSVLGVIPTIKINLHKNPTRTIGDFKKMMDKSMLKHKTTFPKLKVTKASVIIKLDGKDCVYFESVNFIPTNIGEEEVRILTYAVPTGNNFFQINFMDTKKDDNEKVFREIIKTIRF